MTSRGLDIRRATTVFNIEAPEDDATYVHRAGRVGRLGSGTSGGRVGKQRGRGRVGRREGGAGAPVAGTVVTFVPPPAEPVLAARMARLGADIARITVGTSPTASED